MKFKSLAPKILLRNWCERSPNGSQTDLERTLNGPRTNPERIPNRPRCYEIFSERPVRKVSNGQKKSRGSSDLDENLTKAITAKKLSFEKGFRATRLRNEGAKEEIPPPSCWNVCRSLSIANLRSTRFRGSSNIAPQLLSSLLFTRRWKKGPWG